MSDCGFKSLKRGYGIICKFGSKGTQYAIVHRITDNGNVYIMKWISASKRYTKPVRLFEADYIRQAELNEGPKGRYSVSDSPYWKL